MSEEVKPAPRRRPSASIANSLQASETVALVAQQSPYRERLETVSIPQSLVAGLLGKIAECREMIARGQRGTSGRQVASAEEQSARAELLAVIRQMQAFASQKFARDAEQRHRLADYGIGKRLGSSRAALAQQVVTLLTALEADNLPGVTPALKATLLTARESWVATSSQQSAQQGTATGSRAEAKVLAKEITDTRIQIQYAIEGLYPASDPTCTAARTAFLLPEKRPFRG